MSLKLSLERPYKDDLGRSIPAVLDIFPDGRRIDEPCVSVLLVLRAHNIICHVQRRGSWYTARREFKAHVLRTRVRFLQSRRRAAADQRTAQ